MFEDKLANLTIEQQKEIENIANIMHSVDTKERWQIYKLTGSYPKASHREDYIGMARPVYDYYKDSHSALVEAVEANVAWHYCEEKGLGGHKERADLCSYSEYLSKKALGITSGEYRGVPFIQVFPEVKLTANDESHCRKLVEEAFSLMAAENEKLEPQDESDLQQIVKAKQALSQAGE